MALVTRTRRIAAALAIAAGAAISTPAVAFAQAYPGGRTVQTVPPDKAAVLGVQEQKPVEVLGVQQERGGLAVTGGDVVGLTLIGLGLVGGGIVLVRRGKRPATSAA